MTALPRRAVVTGGSGGIGGATVDRLVAMGFVVEVWDHEIPRDARPRPEVTYRAVDVASHDSVRAAAGEHTSLDLLVNAAGVAGARGPIVEQTFEDWDRVVAVDLSGPFYCSIALYPALVAAAGVVVNVTSIAARVMQEGRAHYAVAKSGLETLTRSLGYEWAPVGVRVVAVSPGYTRTPLVDAAIAGGHLDQDFLDSTSRRGRMATPEEIARVITALAGDDFGFVTGEVITADGGGALGWIRDSRTAGGT
ncbi:SDR family oxidoreductase [Nocardioides albidus]|uniref:SDR family oxidoreductase n=1 Tax=Nocardioides albidus TaxID=1517589 RepID=A0A5C4VRT6_9ACTN|nr:SDR family oxidoreductase [Nocardioides albidus]TNM38520.1 SDR family oxidoreductase [Nocardioides albidus]